MKSPSFKTIIALACGAGFILSKTANAQQPAPSAAPGEHQCEMHGDCEQDGPHYGGPKDSGKFVEKLTTDLNLTPVQQVTMKTILDQADAQKKAIMDSTTLTEDQKHAQMKEVHDGAHAQITAILTPEQKAKFEQFKPERGRREQDKAQ